MRELGLYIFLHIANYTINFRVHGNIIQKFLEVLDILGIHLLNRMSDAWDSERARSPATNLNLGFIWWQ